MTAKPFPKPLPAEPMPERDWLVRADRAEVGREAFFCGRDVEYEMFRSAVDSLRSGNIGGGTMIFQGAPGAGKSALMLECAEAVRKHSTAEEPWLAVSIKPDTLQCAAATAGLIIRAANAESERLAAVSPATFLGKFNGLLDLGVKMLGELPDRGFGIAGISLGGRTESGDVAGLPQLAEPVFADAAPLLRQFRIAVFVDEAQNTPAAGMTRSVLDCLHNPPSEIPMVATCFGLSDTEAALRECGLSRFADERIVDLEPLSNADARTSIRRMLDAYYVGSSEEKSVWADALAKLSQGWPQHINRVGVAAGRVLRSNEGRLKRSLLKQAMAKGAERKDAYYKGRVAAGSSQPWLYKRLALAASEKEGKMANSLTYHEIKALTEPARRENKQSTDEFLPMLCMRVYWRLHPKFSANTRFPFHLLATIFARCRRSLRKPIRNVCRNAFISINC